MPGRKNLKYLDEWELDKQSKKVVKKELLMWSKHFQNVSKSNIEIRKDDFKDDDVFFFTDCRDIISETKESRGQELDENINKRKDRAFIHLFLRKLAGDRIHKVVNQCSHCGYREMDIFSCEDGYGYFHWCPHCFKTTLVSYPAGYSSSFEFMLGKVRKVLRRMMDAKK